MSMKTRGHNQAGHPEVSGGPADKLTSSGQNVNKNRERFWCAAVRDVVSSHS
jgi:hypothetical protein